MIAHRTAYVAAKLAPDPRRPPDRIADYLADLLGPVRPRRVARMYDPGGDKYRDLAKEKPLTRQMLLDHASGVRTYATTLDQDGLSRVGVVEVDQGGRSAVLAVLAAAQQLGLTCYAIAVDNPLSGHSGGHVIFSYGKGAPNAAIVDELQQVVTAADLSNVEIWPCNQVIRLPLGYHRWAKTRGQLLTQHGEVVDLDTDLASGVDLLLSLRPNAAPKEMLANVSIVPIDSNTEQQTTHKGDYPNRRASPGEQAAARMASGRIDTRAIFTEAIKRWNADHPHYISESLVRGGDGNHFCECGNHSSGKPKVAISFYGGIERGRSWSPDCAWFPSGDKNRFLDPFALYVLREHGGNERAAKEAAAREYGLWVEPRKRTRREDPPLVEPIEYRTAAQAQDAERKRAARVRKATATIADIEARASQDAELSDRSQLVLLGLLETAGDRDWTRASVARLAALTGLCERYVHDGLRQLETLGYIVSGRRNGSTTFRTFIRLQDYVKLADESIGERDPIEPLELVSGRASSAQPENVYASTLDEWQACESAIGDEVLLWLVEQETQHNTTPKKDAPPNITNTPTRAPEGGIVLNTELLDQGTAEPVFSDSANTVKSEQRARCEQLLAMSDAQFAAWFDAHEAPAAVRSSGNPHYAQTGGASYEPLLDWTNGGRLDLSTWRDPREMRMREQPIGTVNLLTSGDPDADDPLVRCAPTEPKAANEYYALKNKKAASAKQAVWMRRRVAELEVLRPLSEVQAAEERRPRSQARGRRPPVAADNATLWAPN